MRAANDSQRLAVPCTIELVAEPPAGCRAWRPATSHLRFANPYVHPDPGPQPGEATVLRVVLTPVTVTADLLLSPVYLVVFLVIAH